MARQLKIRGDLDDKLVQAINVIVKMLTDGMQQWQNIKTEMGKIGQNPEQLREFHAKLTDRVYQIEYWSRKPFTSSTVKIYLTAVQKFYNGMYPCRGEHQILNPLGGPERQFGNGPFQGLQMGQDHRGLDSL
jgi:hypothetical protein